MSFGKGKTHERHHQFVIYFPILYIPICYNHIMRTYGIKEFHRYFFEIAKDLPVIITNRGNPAYILVDWNTVAKDGEQPIGGRKEKKEEKSDSYGDGKK